MFVGVGLLSACPVPVFFAPAYSEIFFTDYKGIAFLWRSIRKSYNPTLKSYKSDGLHHCIWKNWRADTKNPRDSI